MLNLLCLTTLKLNESWEAKRQQCLLELIGIRSANYVQGATVIWIEMVLTSLCLVAVLKTQAAQGACSDLPDVPPDSS